MLSFTNILGTITAVLATLSGLMVSVLHCSPGAMDFAATCDAPWLPANLIVIATVLFGIVTFISKLLRPGGPLASLFGPTAVVVAENHPNSGVGTVTPAQVAQP